MHEATEACKRLKPEEVKQLRAASEGVLRGIEWFKSFGALEPKKFIALKL